MLQLYQVFLYNTYFSTSLIDFNVILKFDFLRILTIIVFYSLWKWLLIVYEIYIFDSLRGSLVEDVANDIIYECSFWEVPIYFVS